MSRINNSASRHKYQRGQVLILVALSMVAIFGMVAFVLDIGLAYLSYNELQGATNAAALAGAQGMPDTVSATANATAYSAVAGNSNVHSNLSNVSMVTGYPQYKCLPPLTALGFACPPPANANAIIVRQQATVSTVFARVFGINSLPIATTATAAMRGSTTT